jgi:hypothetical protein
MRRDAIFIAIEKERMRQRDLWGRVHDWGEGDCSSPDVEPIVKASVLSEECGEVAGAVLDKDDALLKDELVQVAAVAVAWLESL